MRSSNSLSKVVHQWKCINCQISKVCPCQHRCVSPRDYLLWSSLQVTSAFSFSTAWLYLCWHVCWACTNCPILPHALTMWHWNYLWWSPQPHAKWLIVLWKGNHWLLQRPGWHLWSVRCGMRIGLCNSHVRNVFTFVLHEALTANTTYDLCDLVA